MHRLLKTMIDALRNTFKHAAIAKPAHHTVTGTQITADGRDRDTDLLRHHMQTRQARLQKQADTDRLVAQARQNLLRDVQNEIAASVAQFNEKNRRTHNQTLAAEADAENAEKIVWQKYISALDRQENRLKAAFNRQVDAAARHDHPDVAGVTRRMTEPVYRMPVPLPEDLVCEN